MVPSFFVEIPFFPINKNGKINRSALPMPSRRFYKRKMSLIEPSNGIEKLIATILSDNLAIDHIGVDDNIFELGIQSLMITKIILQINSTLNVNLTLSALFQLPTIRKLAQHINENHDETDNVFVLIRQGKGNPLFMLPGKYGNLLTFVNFLNHYKGEQPVYGISYNKYNAHAAFKSMQDYAKYLLSQIKLIQPTGPYNLLGYSFGGSVSFEMALQLQNNNEKIDLLALVSADAPIKVGFLPRQLSLELKFFLKPNLYLIKKYIKYRIPHFIKKAVMRPLPNGEVDHEGATQKLWENYYAPTKYTGSLLLISEDTSKIPMLDPHWGCHYSAHVMASFWEKVVIGKVASYKIACSHVDLFAEPIVENIAKIIEKHISQQKVIA